MRANAIIQSVHRELAHYPGVESEIREGGKHKRMVFHRNGASRFLTIAKSPSDHRAGKNALRDFKKTMGELGAQRLDVLPGQVKGRRSLGAVGFSLNHANVILHIPGNSKLIDRFKDANDKAKALWKFELRASADLNAPPMLAIKQGKLPPGKERAPGHVGGFLVKAGGGWRLSLARKQLPALSKMVDAIPSVDVELYEDNGTELVFKLPTGILPTKFKAPAPKPSEAWPEPSLTQQEALRLEPEEAPMSAAVAMANMAAMLAKQPAPEPAMPQNLTLQFPKQSVSVEQAILVLNKAKQRLGNNLRFTVTEGGLLTATHRIGH